MIKQVLKSEGGIRGLYKGMCPTLLREVPGSAALFAAYEALKLSLAKQQVGLLTILGQIPSAQAVCKVCRVMHIAPCKLQTTQCSCPAAISLAITTIVAVLYCMAQLVCNFLLCSHLHACTSNQALLFTYQTPHCGPAM